VLASVRSSAAGTITVVLKKCGPGSLSVRTTPAYAKEFKRKLSSVSSLTVHLSPDRTGKKLLRKKKHPRVSIQLTLIAGSGSIVMHSITVTIGVNGSPGAEEKAATGQPAKEKAKAAQEAEAAAAAAAAKKKAEEEAAAAAKKKAEEEAAAAAAKKKAEEVAADKAAAVKDEAEATADKKAAATDESEAIKLLGEATGSEKAATEQSTQAAELELDAKSFEGRATKDKETAESYKEEAEGKKNEQAEDIESAELDHDSAVTYEGEEQEACGENGSQHQCEVDINDVTALEKDAQAANEAAGKAGSEAESDENKIAPEEELAAEEAAEGAFLAGHAGQSREFQKDDETAATEDKANASKKEHEAPAAKKLAEQKEQEAAAERHDAEVAEKA
jgi:hypothetical protein